MTIRNRELSQFGSFIYIEDSTKNIGIATDLTPYVGIGTTNPQKKLHVVGDIQIDGNLLYQGQLSFGNVDLNTTGIITASGFYSPLGIALTSFDSWNTTGSNIYRAIGNVGIATTNPSEKLDVKGNIKANQFISTNTTGTAPFSVASQTLVTNLNADYLRGGAPGGSTSGDIVTIDATQNLTNKTFPSGIKILDTTILASSGTYTLTFPAENGTILTTGSGVLSGLVTTGNIQNGTILSEDIKDGTIANGKLSNSTISGVSLGSSLSSLSLRGTGFSGAGFTYNGSSAVVVSLAATNVNTGNTLVFRNASGNFNAGDVGVVNLTASQTVQAQDFNSTSDINYKTNIQTIENSLKKIQSLRGVSFEWKDSKKPSLGVLAQELEGVFPQLVNTGEMKSVNYNGLIAVLIEAIKELSQEVEELKKQLNN